MLVSNPQGYLEAARHGWCVGDCEMDRYFRWVGQGQAVTSEKTSVIGRRYLWNRKDAK